MKTPHTLLDVKTLGCFHISLQGKHVLNNWPDETLKVLFCSLLSPLDLSFSWDRICRSMWGLALTRTSRRRLDEHYIRPLNTFLIRELGFNPLITGREGIRIDQQCINLDAIEFHNAVVDGLKQFSLGNNTDALNQFNKAHALYIGSYLPGVPGKIIANTRTELEALFKTVVTHTAPFTYKSANPNHPLRSGPGLNVAASRQGRIIFCDSAKSRD
jgi:hypothetical protein